MNTQTTKRLITTAAVLLALSLTGCGGDDAEPEAAPSASESSEPTESAEPTESEEPTEAPESGSVEAFCAELNTLFESAGEFDPSASAKEQARMAVQALKGFAERIDSVEIPEEMPGDAEAGLETVIKTLMDLDDDATLADFSKLEDDLSPDERRDSEAFTTWTSDNCPSPEVPEASQPTVPVPPTAS